MAANNENLKKVSLGDRDKGCSACKSLHFADEYKSKSNTYDSCCSHGKFVEDKFNNFPLTLKGLLCMNTSFHENIRNANSAFAFGSMKTEIVNFPSGPQCFKVHGQVYHLANTFFFQ